MSKDTSGEVVRQSSKHENLLKKLIDKRNKILEQLTKHKYKLEEAKQLIKDFLQGGPQRLAND